MSLLKRIVNSTNKHRSCDGDHPNSKCRSNWTWGWGLLWTSEIVHTCLLGLFSSFIWSDNLLCHTTFALYTSDSISKAIGLSGETVEVSHTTALPRDGTVCEYGLTALRTCFICWMCSLWDSSVMGMVILFIIQRSVDLWWPSVAGLNTEHLDFVSETISPRD